MFQLEERYRGANSRALRLCYSSSTGGPRDPPRTLLLRLPRLPLAGAYADRVRHRITKILPSPMLPVRAALQIACRLLCRLLDDDLTSLGKLSTV